MWLVPAAGGPARKLDRGLGSGLDRRRAARDLGRARRHLEARRRLGAATPGRAGSRPPTASSRSTATRASRSCRRTAPRWPTRSPRAPTSTAARSAWPRSRAAPCARSPARRACTTASPPGRPTARASRTRRSAAASTRSISSASDGTDDRQLTSARADHGELDWHPDGSRLLALRGRGNRFDLVTVDAESGDAEVVAPGGTWCTPFWTAAGDIVAGYEDHATPRELRRVSGGEPTVVHAPAPLSVKRAPHAELEDVSFPSFDGLEIPAFLMRPRDASAERPVPAVVYPHGGPTMPTATSGTGTRSTSSIAASPGSRSTSAAPPATAATSSARTTASGASTTRRTASPRRTSCARSTGSTASGSASSARATARTWRCCR